MDEDLMPEAQDDDEFEPDLYVDFSSEDAASESRDFEPLPAGKYLMSMYKVDLTEVKNNDKGNLGKKMYNITFRVQEDLTPSGLHVGGFCSTNACLFKPALFTIVHIMKAIGMDVREGRMRIPRPTELEGQLLVVGGWIKPEQKDKNDPSKVYAAKFNPNYFASKDIWPAIKSKGKVVGSAAGKTAASAPRSSLLS